MAKVTNKNATVRQRQLARRLRELRGDYTAAEVQAATGITTSKISRMETCHVRARPEDIRTLATFYGVSDTELDTLLHAAEEAYNSSVLKDFIGHENWASTLRGHLELEADAQRIDSYTIDLVPGLLQSRDYAAALMEARPDVESSTIPDRLDFRAQRQRRVRTGELELWAVISETILHQEIGSAATLADQLDYLAAPPSNVTVQVLPFSAGAHPSLGSAFHVFTFPEQIPTIIYGETLQQALYQDDPDTVRAHKETIEQTKAAALSPRESNRLLQQRATELRTDT